MHSAVYGKDLKKLYPVVEEGMSDSGCVDNVLEFLCMAGGRSLPEVRPHILQGKVATSFCARPQQQIHSER